MFKRFPLFYIAWLYVFSTKDKIVFFMQQFASLVIALCIAALLCTFSLINGFKLQVQDRILKHNSAIILMPHEGSDPMETYSNINSGFSKPQIHSPLIRNIRAYRMQVAVVFIGSDPQRRLFQVYEDPDQKEPIATNEVTAKEEFEKGGLNQRLTLVDLNSYTPLLGTWTRIRHFDHLVSRSGFVNPHQERILTLSSSEYQRFFRKPADDQVNQVNIDLFDLEDTEVVVASIKQQLHASKAPLQNINVRTWRDADTYVFDLLKMQQNIFMLVYFILFILLCAIIISTNVAFFKEKRKDWALLKILHITPLSVERVFLYKNLIFFVLSTVTGLTLGTLLTIYCHDILHLIGLATGSDPSDLLLMKQVSYAFKMSDFFKIIAFSLGIFSINFILLVMIFRRENVAHFLKTQ